MLYGLALFDNCHIVFDCAAHFVHFTAPQPTRVHACLQSCQDRVVMGSTAEHKTK